MHGKLPSLEYEGELGSVTYEIDPGDGEFHVAAVCSQGVDDLVSEPLHDVPRPLM